MSPVGGGLLGPLTARGAAFTGSGVSVVVVGLATGLPSLVRVGVLVAGLPLLVAAALLAARPRAVLERTLEPATVTVGAPSRVRLRVSVTSLLPLHGLRAEDSRSPGLVGRARFELAASTARAGPARGTSPWPPGATVTYRVHPAHRGEHRVGPLVMTVRDPFGLVRGTAVRVRTSARGRGREGRHAEHAVLLAVPAAVPLASGPASVTGTGTDGSTTASPRSGTERSSGIREYLAGDDVRRVHWRATARADRLMVSQEEEPLDQRPAVVLDTGGRWSPAAFERAVVVAASALVALGGGGRELELRTGGRVTSGTAAELLRVLATVQPDRPGPGDGAAGVGPRGRAPAREHRVGSGRETAGVVRVVSGDDPQDRASPPPVAPRAGRVAAALVVGGHGDGRAPADALLAAGWRVALVPPGADLARALPPAWASLQGTRPAPAPAGAPARAPVRAPARAQGPT